MILPAFIYIFIFNYIPMYGVTLAFKDFSASAGIIGSEWIGFDHFRRVFNSPDFVDILINTLTLSFTQLLFTFPLPIILALAINSAKNRRLGKIAQNITYAPYFVSVVVLVGMMFVVFSPSGVANIIASALFGGEARLFMGEQQYFRTMFIGSSIWQTTGWNSIIYIAALTAVSPELHEAAIVDGASKFQRIIYIDLPSLVPTAVIILTLNMGAIMSLGFEKAYLMQTDLNIAVSEILPTYVYKKGLLDIDYGYASAVGLFNNVINLILLATVNKISKKITSTSLW